MMGTYCRALKSSSRTLGRQKYCPQSKQAAKLLKQGAASWLMLVQKDQYIPSIYGMDQGTTCASMVAGQEEGLVAPEVVEKIIKDEFKGVF